MHVFRYDTQVSPDGSPAWRYVVHAEEGHLFRVVVSQDGTGYRWALEGTVSSLRDEGSPPFGSRDQALAAATAAARRAPTEEVRAG